MCDLFNNLDKEKNVSNYWWLHLILKSQTLLFFPFSGGALSNGQITFLLVLQKTSDWPKPILIALTEANIQSYLPNLPIWWKSSNVWKYSYSYSQHVSPNKISVFVWKSTTSGFLPGRTSGNCLVWYLYIPTPFKSLLDVKADNLHLLQTNILIRIAESFYWALACFYEEVSLAEGCLFASSQRWKVGPLAVRRLSGAGGLPELPCCAPHRHSVTFGQAVGVSAWIVVNFCFYANPVGGGRQDRWFSSTVPSQIQMVPLSAVRPFWLGCLFVCSDLFTQCRWLSPFTRV